MRRIVSLLPSATELVCALGARAQLVGRSHECDFPADVKNLPACTSARLESTRPSDAINQQVATLSQQEEPLYRIDSGQLQALRPDVIITQAQCAVCAVSEGEVRSIIAKWPGNHPQIVTLATQRLADVWTDMQQVAEALQIKDQGLIIVSALKNRVVDII